MHKFILNPNILKIKESATLKINQQAKMLREEGKIIYHWGFGESPFPVPLEIQSELKQRSSHKEYITTAGLTLLRQTIANYYQKNYNLDHLAEDDIFIGPGSKELLFQLFYLLEGDYIIPAPSWVSYLPQLQIKKANVHLVQTHQKNGYRLTAELLQKAIEQKKSLQIVLILNSPSNPTGQVYSEQDLKELLPLLEKNNVIVISDEIYAQVDFSAQHSPSLASLYSNTIITGGLSKSYSAGGYRLGYMILPPHMKKIGQFLKSFISETFSAVSTPIQYSAVKAWDLSQHSVFEQVALYTKIHSLIGSYFSKRFHQMGLNSTTAQGAFYLFIDFENYRQHMTRKKIFTSVDLCHHLLTEWGICLLPGSDFYRPKEELSARVAFVDYDGSLILEKIKDSNLNLELILATYPQLKQGLDTLERFLKNEI